MTRTLPSAPPVIAGLDYIRPLGSGGFADVFLYRQDLPRRPVAVKVLPEAAGDPERLRVFHAEADVLARLSAHPAIVTVYQAGISADGRPYIVMEYCPGSLARRFRDERMPVEEVMDIAVRLAGALETAHRAGLIHRDIKPSNILVTSFGAAVLADFGIAASLQDPDGDQLLAMSLPWSAPEVVAEQTTGTVASEVWALGATVYSLLAGRSPFEKREREQNTREKLGARIRRAALAPVERDDVPRELQSALATAMARDPAARYRSAQEFGRAVQEAQRAAGGPATPLDIPVVEWEPVTGPSDAATRGPVRSKVPDATRRVPRSPNGAVPREEDDVVWTRARPPAWWLPAVIAGGVAMLIGVVAAVLRVL